MDRVDYESVIIQDLLNFYDRDELNITPWYQRRSVWKSPQKAYLINTIFEQKPVPSLYIRHSIDLEREVSIKEVVDGQQRVRCLLEYRAGDFKARHPRRDRPVAFSELTKAERSTFLLTSLSVGYLVGATDQDVIDIFARINSVAKTLTPQEKRNARFGGEFRQFSVRQAVERLPFWRQYGVFSDNDVARMVEVQFISDLVMNLDEGLQDFSAKKLDDYYAKHDEDYPKSKAMARRLDQIFAHLLAIDSDILRGSVFARPQVLFSFAIAIDALPARKLTKRRLEGCVSTLDSAVETTRGGTDVLSTEVFQAFTSGNMHRIRFRRLRDKVIREHLR